MKRYTRIYFDSSALIAEGWPSLSANLQRCLQLAEFFKVRTYMPRVVELELEAHWLRTFKERRQELESKLSRLNEHLLVGKAEISIPNQDDVLGEYRGAVQKIRDAYKIATTPVAGVSLEQVLMMSIDRQAPFMADKDKGFQDALIILSILGELEGVSEAAVFVTRDDAFSSPGIQTLIQRKRVKLSVLRSAGVAADNLMQHLKDVLKRLYRHESKLAKDAVLLAKERLEEFIGKHLEIPEDPFALDSSLPPGRIDMVPVIELSKIKKVVPATRPWEKKPGEKVRLSIEAEVILEVLVRLLPEPVRRTLRVGKEPVPGRLPGPLIADIFAKPEAMRVTKDVLIEASAMVLEASYTEIEFLSARLE